MNVDTDVFEELMREHEGIMYRTAYLYVKNRQDALDVVQEAACRAYRGIDRLRERRYVRTWLVRITMNCAIDMLRRQGREKPCPPDMLENIGPVSEDEVRAVIERITLEQLMHALDASEKQAVMLRYYCGYSFAEMAAELTVPLGTAKTLLYRALDKLKKRAAEDESND